MKITPIDPAALLLPFILTRWSGHDVQPPFFRLSGLGWCPEKQYLPREGHTEAPTRPDFIRKQQIGHALESWVLDDAAHHFGQPVENRQAVVALMAERVVNGKHTTIYFLGHIDGTIDGKIIDAKATGSFAFNSKYRKMAPDNVPTPELDADRTIQAYKTQIGAYALGLKLNGAILAIRNRDTSSYDVVWEDVYYSWPLAELRPLVERGIENYFERTNRDVEPWECKFCSWSAVCQVKKTEVLAPNPAYELLSQYRKADDEFRRLPMGTTAEYEDNRAKIDAILEKARKALKELPASDRRPYHDGFGLSWSKSDRLTITDQRK